MLRNNSSKFRSPYRGIDLVLLRLLCDLHPLPRRDLCRHVGMGVSILSNVLSGQRPLPTSAAKQFLELVGMRLDGSLDPDHGFVFAVKAGRESDLGGLIRRMFPDKAGVVRLQKIGASNERSPGTNEGQRGFALFYGKFAAVIHSPDWTIPGFETGGEDWDLRNDSSAGVLLSTNPLPTKVDIVRAFAGASFPIEVTWAAVLAAAEAKNFAAVDVLQLISDAPMRVGR